MKVTVVSERVVTETKEAEVIGQIYPQEIQRLELHQLKPEHGQPGGGYSPVVWPPLTYAVEPRFDYYLVRVPRSK